MNPIILLIMLYVMPYVALAATQPAGIGGFAKGLIEPVEILSNFISTGCFIIGIMLLMSALLRYLQYRVNPLASPIGTVFILLFLGIVLICLPFLYLLLGAGIPFSLFGSS